MTPEEARAQFPVLRRYAYLNAGSAGPLARATHDAMVAAHEQQLELGRGSRAYVEQILAARERLRELLARVLAVDTANVALTTSTTEGCNIVVAGLELAAGDEVVTTDVEHFGLLGPLAVSPATVRVARVRDRPAADALAAILAEVTPRTRLVALSHVAWTTGHVLPVGEVSDAVSCPVLVDGAQSIGAIPVDASPFDFYTLSGQKWLCGPTPTGALYVREPERLRVAHASYFSQRSYEVNGSFTPREGAARFDPAWIPLEFIAGLETAVTSAPAWRYDRARELAGRLRTLLVEREVDVVTEPDHATLVSFRAGDDAEALARRLGERDVIVRDLPGTGWVRASCGYWTDEVELERLVEAL